MSKANPRNEEFHPKNFGLFNLDPKTSLALHPWRQLGRQVMMFQVAVAGNEDAKKLKIDREASEEINRRCDDFIVKFVDAQDRSGLAVPVDLRGYLTLRAIKACLVCKFNEQTGVPAPEFYKENFRKEILELLIDAWYSDHYTDEIVGLSRPPSRSR